MSYDSVFYDILKMFQQNFKIFHSYRDKFTNYT